MNAPELCPFCRNTSVVAGRFSLGDTWGGPGFEPAEIEPPGWRKALGVDSCARVAPTGKACAHCGKVWASLEVEELQGALRKYGTEDCKARLAYDLNPH